MQLRSLRPRQTHLDGCFGSGEIAAISITMLILCEAEKLADIFQCPVAGGFGDSAYSGRTHLTVGLWPGGHHE